MSRRVEFPAGSFEREAGTLSDIDERAAGSKEVREFPKGKFGDNFQKVRGWSLPADLHLRGIDVPGRRAGRQGAPCEVQARLSTALELLDDLRRMRRARPAFANKSARVSVLAAAMMLFICESLRANVTLAT